MPKYTLSPATEALLALDGYALPDPATPLEVAHHVVQMVATNPSIRRAVRDAAVALEETRADLAQPGQKELLSLSVAAKALQEASAAMLDAVLDANDFLHGEGLPGIHI